jgi:hypothetical protein
MKRGILDLRFIIAVLAILGISFQARSGEQPDLPATVNSCSINMEVRENANKLPSEALRVNYLSSIVLANHASTNAVENSKAGAAIRLVGVIKSANSISILISNLAFVDTNNHDRPAVEALAAIGDAAIPQLLGVLEDSSASEEKCLWAVEAMKWIKQASAYEHMKDWVRFMMEQKSKLPQKAWERLWRYGAVD